jgi:cellulose synthase/poly-beta-1,6-N-acetylglucosamine synthase-like glycosyltransferase
MVAVAFWISLFVGLYPYLVYPVLASALAALRNHPVRADPSFVPRVTIVIAAFDEAAVIEATLRNKIGQDYPRELLEIIVVSDGSSDATDDVVRKVAAEDGRVQLIRQEPRQGKTAALNRAAGLASGEVMVFSDANSIFRLGALRALVSCMADPTIGYVTGRMLYTNPDGSLVGDGCSAYMRLENFLRAVETRIGSVVGVDGGIDAVRRSLFRPMRPDQLPDFVLPLNVVEQGYRVVYEPRATLTEEALQDDRSEFRMRVRVALRALWGIWDKRRLLNPFLFPLFSWQLLSHKLLRYVSFAPLALATLLNWGLLAEGSVYLALAGGQVLFVLLVLSTRLPGGRSNGFTVARYCYYFALLNWSSAVAFCRFLAGQKVIVWQPRTG